MFNSKVETDFIANPSLSRKVLENILQEPSLLEAVYEENYFDMKDWEATSFSLQIANSNMCGTYSPRLTKELRKRGIHAIEATSYDSESSYHVYVALFTIEEFHILDPSIGQYVEGFRGIYSGTPEELRTYLEDPDTILFQQSDSLNEFYSKTWGFSRGTAYQGRIRINGR